MAKQAKNQNENFVEQTTENTSVENSTSSIAETHEENKNEPAPPAKKKRPGKTIVSGAEFLEFTKEGETFVGAYLGTKSIREKDGKEAGQKAGDVMGYNFVTSDGTEVIVGNSYAVQKAMETVKKDDVLYIEFLGKAPLDGGRTVNKLHIAILDETEKKDYGF